MSDTASSTPTSVPSGNDQPTPKRRSWRWRFFRFVVLSFAALVTLFVLFHAEENWRGKRAWEQYRKEQEAKGVSFDFNSVVPPPVPDEKNFAMTPLLKPVLDLNPPGTYPRQKDTNAVKRLEKLNVVPLPSRETNWVAFVVPVWREGQRVDLKLWQTSIFESTNLIHNPEKGIPGEDVLHALEPVKGEFAELIEASRRRPLSRFEIAYTDECKAGILLPHLAPLKGMFYTLQTRTVANLSIGRIDDAFTDVNLMFTLTDSMAAEPIIISKLVRQACLQATLQTVWEGLVDHRWKPEHLVHWQQKLSGYDFIKDGYHGLVGERAFGNGNLEFLREYPHLMGRIGYNDSGVSLPSSDGWEGHWFKLIPGGWFYFEQLNYNIAYDQFILAATSPTKEQIDLKKQKKISKAMELEFADRNPWKAILGHRVLSHLLLPWVKNFTQKSVYAQSTTDLAIVAIGLERYHLKHQDYPASLDILVPDYVPVLPLDITVKTSFKYERQSKDDFRLWSVGWNEKDENGEMAAKGSTRNNLDEGDWTWPQAAKE